MVDGELFLVWPYAGSKVGFKWVQNGLHSGNLKRSDLQYGSILGAFWAIFRYDKFGPLTGF